MSIFENLCPKCSNFYEGNFNLGCCPACHELYYKAKDSKMNCTECGCIVDTKHDYRKDSCCDKTNKNLKKENSK